MSQLHGKRMQVEKAFRYYYAGGSEKGVQTLVIDGVTEPLSSFLPGEIVVVTPGEKSHEYGQMWILTNAQGKWRTTITDADFRRLTAAGAISKLAD